MTQGGVSDFACNITLLKTSASKMHAVRAGQCVYQAQSLGGKVL